jgi:polyisoprenyl-teichoic acid--peptidoglycan teichoic acid transferase
VSIPKPENQTQNQRPRKIGWIFFAALLVVTVLGLLFSRMRPPEPAATQGATSLASSPDETQATIKPRASRTPAQTEEFLAADTPGSEATKTATVEVLPTPDPWDGKSRVTILVLGLDYADWENTDRVGPPRSDLMILLTVDPVSKTIGILSIPRDLWVSMPGIEGEHKINTAHRFGELYELPGGGPGLAVRTVEELFEVPINFYIRVDFQTFEDVIDELGGIEVDVPEEIQVDPIGPDNTVVLQPGKQILDGPTTLAYARNRQTEEEDFGRSKRQQQVILAIREKVFGIKMLPLLVSKAPLMYERFREGIQTDLTLKQMIQLAWLVQKVPKENIERVVIGSDDVIYATSPDGEAIYRPIPERMRAIRDEIFHSAEAGQAEGMTTEELIAAENARITLINETGDEEMGEQTAKYLLENGLNVIETVPSEKTRPLTRLVDLADNPYTLRSLINLLQVSPSEIYLNYDPEAGTDMTIYLGEDWAEDNPLK